MQFVIDITGLYGVLLVQVVALYNMELYQVKFTNKNLEIIEVP